MPEPQLDVRIDAQPEEFRRLFDPQQALLQTVLFIPDQTDKASYQVEFWIIGVFVGGIFAASGAFGIVEMTISLLTGAIAARTAGDAAAVAGVYLALIAMIGVAWWQFWTPLAEQAAALREKEAGTLRRGFFLTPGAIVMRKSRGRCTVFPREIILDVEKGFTRVSQRGSVPTLWLTCRHGANGRRKVSLHSYAVLGLRADQDLADQIRAWAGLEGSMPPAGNP